VVRKHKPDPPIDPMFVFIFINGQDARWPHSQDGCATIVVSQELAPPF